MAILKPGSLLDRRYRVIQTLAKGGFGQTYIAEDTRRPGNPRCVVKHLKPASSDSRFLDNARRLFSTEAEILEKLGTHDQIPRLLAYFEEEREFYLVLDLVEGHTLTHELQMGHRWTEAQICQLLRDLLNVLEFVHHYGVIHRDIKPENLIRRKHDNKLVLVDFGTVKQIRTQQVKSGQMTVTIAVGTPGYMPTEQNHGKPRPNSDLYALGIIGLQAATGLLPGQLQDDAETGELVWQPWAAQIRPDLAAILNGLVRYHFKDRYQSATEVLQILGRVFDQHPDLLTEVETQPPPAVVSTPSETPASIHLNPLQPQKDHFAMNSLTRPLDNTGSSDPLKTSIAPLSSLAQPITLVKNLNAADTAPDPLEPQVTQAMESQEGLKDLAETPITVAPPSLPSAQPEIMADETILPSTQISPISQARSPNLPEQMTNLPQAELPQPAKLPQPDVRASATPSIPRVDLTSPPRSQMQVALPLSRILTQPASMGIGVVALMVLLLIGIPALLTALPTGKVRLTQSTGWRTVFTPLQESLLKVLLINLPCQASPPKTQLPTPLVYPNGAQYFGTLSNGLANDDQGVFLFPDGSRYQGRIQNDKFDGCGQYTYSPNQPYSSYIGQFQNNAFNGLGVLSFVGGDRYIGLFRNGKCHGQGTFISANGTLNRGNWQDGKSVDGDNTLSCLRDSPP